MIFPSPSRLVLPAVISFVVYAQHLSGQEHCRSDKSSTLAIQSTRNSTGHWISKVSVENPSASGVVSAGGVLSPDHWKVEIDHKIDGCGSKETFFTSFTLPPVPAGPGYELFEGTGYYKFHTDAKVWPEALRECELEGAHLAIINSAEEAAVLNEIFSRHKNIPDADFMEVAAIGFHDRYVEGQYLTIDDEPLENTGYVRWSTVNGKQPNNYQGSDTNPGEDCGSIQRDGGLNDISCFWKVAFICEQEL